ncbi:MAG: c-type cytochrome biogenesis protein CcsB [Dehalococcoidia bacterium]
MDAEQLAYNAFLFGFAIAGFAAVCYIALPLWPRVVYRSAATDAGATMTVAAQAQLPGWLGPLATIGTWLAVLVLTISLGARWQATGHPPYANMWEYTVGFGWGILLAYGLFEWRNGQRAEGWPSARTVGAFVLPVALALFAIALAFFPPEVRPLIPALQSNQILGAHVATMMLSYAALSISFGAGVMYLLQGSARERRFARLPSRETLEEIASRSVLIGFPMLTLGITLGAFWASQAWGRYWGWDAKETSALVVWLIYAGYLHARNLRGWRGTKSAWLLVFGFAAVMFTYFAVNLWVSGLHSYSGV